MPATAYARRPAMGTLFEVFLAGGDAEHLQAVANAVIDEILRVEKLLSRFNPASEITRINRSAAAAPVVVDFEVWDILAACLAGYKQTDGYFDVTARPGHASAAASSGCSDESCPFALDANRRSVRLPADGRTLDLGAFGKGYALDRLRDLLREFQIDSGLIHGGTSSILAVGRSPEGAAWGVGLRDPFLPDGVPPLAFLQLRDQALSCSAAFSSGQTTSDVLDPLRGEPLHEQAGCVVLAPTATQAEIFSTALLSMGQERAAQWLQRSSLTEPGVGWIDRAGEETRLEWLAAPGGEASL